MDDGFVERAARTLDLDAETVRDYIVRGESTKATALDLARYGILVRMGYHAGPAIQATRSARLKMRRKKWSLDVDAATRRRLLEKRGACERCGSTRFLQVHHKVPRSVGGDDSDGNLMLLCYKCHFGIYHRPGRYGIHTRAIEAGECQVPLLWRYP